MTTDYKSVTSDHSCAQQKKTGVERSTYIVNSHIYSLCFKTERIFARYGIYCTFVLKISENYLLGSGPSCIFFTVTYKINIRYISVHTHVRTVQYEYTAAEDV